MKKVDFDWPPAGEADLELTCALIRASAQRFEELTDTGRFFVVVYPGSTYGRSLREKLANSGVGVLDYTDLFDGNSPSYRIEGDGHPNAKAMRILGKQLSLDLLQFLGD